MLLDKKKKKINRVERLENKHVLKKLQKDLRLKDLPINIECFDNSNLQGTDAVAACVVFKNAKPSKKDYRHFNIKTVLQGRVVDMFYFPLINDHFPNWMPFLGGEHFIFFRPVFNIADAGISVGVFLILIFYRKTFN